MFSPFRKVATLRRYPHFLFYPCRTAALVGISEKEAMDISGHERRVIRKANAEDGKRRRSEAVRLWDDLREVTGFLAPDWREGSAARSKP